MVFAKIHLILKHRKIKHNRLFIFRIEVINLKI
jgi:hypothetical protein